MALGQYHPTMEKKPQDSDSRSADKYIIRFPDGMRDKIAEAAKANGRSINAEIIARLSATNSNISPSQALDAIVLLTQDRTRIELEVRHLYFELSILASHFAQCLSEFPAEAIKPGSALEKDFEEWCQIAQEKFDMAKPHIQPADAVAAVREFLERTEKAKKRVPGAYPPGKVEWPAEFENFEPTDYEPPPAFEALQKRIQEHLERRQKPTAKRISRTKKT